MASFFFISDGKVCTGKADSHCQDDWEEFSPRGQTFQNDIISLIHTPLFLFVDFRYFYICRPFGFFHFHGDTRGYLPLLLRSEFSVILVAGIVGDGVALAVVALPIAYEVFVGLRVFNAVHIVPNFLLAAGDFPDSRLSNFTLERTGGVIGIADEEAIAFPGFSSDCGSRSESDAVVFARTGDPGVLGFVDKFTVEIDAGDAFCLVVAGGDVIPLPGGEFLEASDLDGIFPN